MTPRANSAEVAGLTPAAAACKRLLDLAVAATLLVGLSGLIALAWLAATCDTRRNGLFVQERVGRGGRRFRLFKIRTMRDLPGHLTSVTTARDPRITPLGRWLRRLRIDELPQLVNVLRGEMSLVGPRPEVPEYADTLHGADRAVLAVRPGLTGPATLKYRREEEWLSRQEQPEVVYRRIVYPDKVRINRRYVETYRFRDDLRCLLATLLPPLTPAEWRFDPSAAPTLPSLADLSESPPCHSRA